jgi:hypothetical protein
VFASLYGAVILCTDVDTRVSVWGEDRTNCPSDEWYI